MLNHFGMSRKRRHLKNRLFLDSLSYTGEYSTPTIVDVVNYNAKGFNLKHCKGIEDFPHIPLSGEQVLWVKFCGYTKVDWLVELGKRLALDNNSIQEILSISHIAKVSIFEKNIFIALNDFYYDDHQELHKEQVYLLLGKGFVASFQESNRPIFDSIGKALEANSAKVREKSADYLFATLVDCIVDSYMDAIWKMEQEFDGMEERLLGVLQSDNRPDGIKILNLRKDLQRLKHTIIPLKEQVQRLAHLDDNELILKENEHFYTDVGDHLLLAVQLLESGREELESLSNLYVVNNDTRLNEIMKRLTVVATIFIPLTFATGVWGMNFKYMPELAWKWGYAVAWISLIGIAVFTWWYLRRRKWF